MKTLTLAECMNIYGGCYIYSSSTSLTSVPVGGIKPVHT